MRSLIALMILFASFPAVAHEFRSAHLEVAPAARETSLTLSRPIVRGRPLSVDAEIIGCAAIDDPLTRTDAIYERRTWKVDCGEDDLDRMIVMPRGLTETGIDLVVRWGDATKVLTAQSPRLSLSELQDPDLWGFVRLGMHHIAIGYDHVLFVLGLMLLIGTRWRELLRAITSFTVAHSLTLFLAATGRVHVPTQAVEAIIALSIVLLAWEITTDSEREQTLTWRKPWIFAFACGLLHGLGFASALTDAGLPQANIVPPLVAFNVGVEMGQITLVACALLLVRALVSLRPMSAPTLTRGRLMVATLIGGISTYWFMTRTIQIFT